MRKINSTPHGFSLPEVIISVAIISLTALGVSTLFIEGTKSTKRADQGSACTNHLNTVMNRFRSLGTRTETLDFIMDEGASAADRWPVAGGTITPEGTPASLVPNHRFPLNANFNVTTVPPVGNPVQTQNAHLIKGMINGLSAIYNSQADAGGSLYCQTAAGLNYFVAPTVESDLFTPSATTNTLRNLNTTIRIQQFDLSSGTLLACNNAAAMAPLILAPRGNPTQMSERTTTGRPAPFANGQRLTGTRTLEAGACATAGAIQSASPIQGQVYCDNPAGLEGIELGPNVRNNLGFLVELRANYQDANGNAGGCTAQMRVQYPEDNNAPSRPTIDVVRNSTRGIVGFSQFRRSTETPNLGVFTPEIENGANSNVIFATIRPADKNDFGPVKFHLNVGYPANPKAGTVFLCRDRSYKLPPVGPNAGPFAVAGALNFWAGCRFNGVIMPNRGQWPLTTGGGFNNYGYPRPKINNTAWRSGVAGDVPYIIGSSQQAFGPVSSWPTTIPFGNMTQLGDNRWRPCDKATVCGLPPTGGTVDVLAGVRSLHRLEWEGTGGVNTLPYGCVVQLDAVAVDGAGNMSQVATIDHTNLDSNIIEYPTCGRYCGSDFNGFGGASSAALGYFSFPVCP